MDRRVLTDTFAENIIANLQGALRPGVDRWLDDSLAEAQPWGFDLAEITAHHDLA